MPRRRPVTRPATPIAVWTLAVVAVLFFLQAAKSLMIPIAIAVLISYALAPVVNWLADRRVPKILGAALVILLVLGLSGMGLYFLRDDASAVAAQLPKATARARGFVQSRLGPAGQAIEQAARSAHGGQSASAPRGGAEMQPAPMAASLLQTVANGVVAFAGHFVVVVFLIYFLLISGHHVRDRLVEIAGTDAERRQMVATIVDDVSVQIQRYLLVVLVTASLVGLSTWLVLMWMGVRQAAMWGVLAGLFNSIPYFGPIVVTGGLFVVGIAQGGGLAQASDVRGQPNHYVARGMAADAGADGESRAHERARRFSRPAVVDLDMGSVGNAPCCSDAGGREVGCGSRGRTQAAGPADGALTMPGPIVVITGASVGLIARAPDRLEAARWEIEEAGARRWGCSPDW